MIHKSKTYQSIIILLNDRVGSAAMLMQILLPEHLISTGISVAQL
jgi:hypothetical protein